MPVKVLHIDHSLDWGGGLKVTPVSKPDSVLVATLTRLRMIYTCDWGDAIILTNI